MKLLSKAFLVQSFLPVAGLCVLVGSIGLFVGKAIGSWESEREQVTQTKEVAHLMGTIKIGDRLPDHEFETLDRDTVWLSNLVKRGAVITFVSGNCESCEFQMEELSKGIPVALQSRFILITSDNPRYLEDLLAIHTSSAYALYDHRMIYWKAVNIKSVPITVVVNSELKVRDFVSGNLLASNLLALLNESETK